MKLALIGYGKMGKAIEEVALQRGHQVILNLISADAAIEFTSPHSAFENVKKLMQFGVPTVCGSTGWLEKLDNIHDLCIDNHAAFLYASNFSVGVNIFFEVNKRLAALMAQHNDYELQLTEIHHTAKKDAPSGTAITLAEQILKMIPRKTKWVNHISDNTDELEIISERIDPAPGTHKIKYSSPIDDIEIIHTAHSRKGFAGGAVLAAEFLLGKKGIYSMKDVLGL
jgi:4-hydroxy-tetrahydrodipicolinate reductase